MADENYIVGTKDGKKLYGEEAKKYERQEKAKENLAKLEKENTFTNKAKDVAEDVVKGIGKIVPGYGSLPSIVNRELGESTKKRSRELEEAKKAVNMKKGGSVSSASKRADGCAIRGKTRAKYES